MSTVTKTERRALRIVEWVKLADFIRTAKPVQEFLGTQPSSYQKLADFLGECPDWNGDYVPVGTLEEICSELGIRLGEPAFCDSEARRRIAGLENIVGELITRIDAMPTRVVYDTPKASCLDS